MISRRGFLAMAAGLLGAAPLMAQQGPPGQRGPKGPRGPQGRGGPQGPDRGPKGPLAPLRALGKTVILGAPTATSIRLHTMVDEPMTASLRVTDSRGTTVRTVPTMALQAAAPCDLRVEGLQPGQEYTYELVAKPALAGSSASATSTTLASAAAGAPCVVRGKFRTARRRGEVFRFAVHADPHNRDDGFTPALYEETWRRTLQETPDFVIDLGDNFMTEKFAGSEADALQCVHDMRPYYGLACHSTPLFLMNGNHEAELGWYGASPLRSAANRYRKACYPCPTADGFYSGDTEAEPGFGRPDVYTAWHWGDALFVLLDPFWYTVDKPGRGGVNNGWNWTLGEKQYRWLERTLRGSHAAAKFVFCHHLVGGGDSARGGVEFARLYEWGGRSPEGTQDFARYRPGWSKPIHDLMVETGVTIFFHGHDHFYAMQELDGVVYQLVPQPSHRNMHMDHAAEYGYTSGVFLPNSGHLQVDVAAGKVGVRYVRSGQGDAAALAHQYERSTRKTA